MMRVTAEKWTNMATQAEVEALKRKPEDRGPLLRIRDHCLEQAIELDIEERKWRGRR